MMVAPTVVFDLDGTLVDSAPDLVATLNVIFAREGLPPVAYDTARNLVGGGARSMIERSLAAQERKLDTAGVDGLVKDFVEHYAAHIADRSRAFPGLEAALDELAAGGCRFAVCTNKLNGSRCGSLTRLASQIASPPFAGPTRSGCKSPIRTCCGGRSRAPAAIPVTPSWSGIPSATSLPPARQEFQSLPSTMATPRPR